MNVEPESINCEVNKVYYQQGGLAAAAAALLKQLTCDAVNHIEVAIIGRYYNVQALVLVHQPDKYCLQKCKFIASRAVLVYESSSLC